jgi:hypothetical protein
LIQQGPTPKAPTAPTAPTSPLIAGVPSASSAPSASAVYEGFKAQRQELRDQLNDLQGTRSAIAGQLEDMPASSPERKPLETRLTDVDSRITDVDQRLAANALDISKAAAIPGAVVEPPPEIRQGPPEEAWVLGGLFMILVFFPLSVAFARRIWRRSAVAVAGVPREIGERLLRMEQAVEATAEEVERIGEGQRFLTRLFTEGEGARAIGGGAAQPIERKSVKAPERLP